MKSFYFSFLVFCIFQVLSIPTGVSGTLSQSLNLLQTLNILGCLNQSPNLLFNFKPYQTTDVFLQDLGYFVENYTVLTEDHYILNVFRITGSPQSPPPTSGQKKKAVYLNHGIAATSNQWLVQQGQNSLAQVLADQGYEVWLGNCRGNSYSSGHETLNSKTDLKYWNFTWHEMGIYDVPAVIEKILEVSGNDQIYYVGYSMGTTQYMVMLSEKPELNAKIRTGILLAPVAYLEHSYSILRSGSLLGLGYNQTYLYNIFGGRINTNDALEKYFGINAGDLCSASAVINCVACTNVMFLIFGFDPFQMNYVLIFANPNKKYLPSFYTNYADVIGTKTAVHYTQLMWSGKFGQFDYGTPESNEDVYGTGVTKPPTYNLSQITAPTVFFHAPQDNLSPPVDATRMKNEFNPVAVKEFNLVNFTYFNHLDFVIAKDLKTLILDKVMTILNNDIYGQ